MSPLDPHAPPTTALGAVVVPTWTLETAVSPIAELSQVVTNAMARFDAIPGASKPARGGGLSGAAQRDIARKSGNRVLFRVVGAMALLAVAAIFKPSFEVTGIACCVVLAGTIGGFVIRQRRTRTQAHEAVDTMPAPLQAAARQVRAFREALPPSYGQLGEAIETIEARMARVFNGADATLTISLLKLTGKVFGYAGFDALALREPSTAPALATLKSAVAAALAG